MRSAKAMRRSAERPTLNGMQECCVAWSLDILQDGSCLCRANKTAHRMLPCRRKNLPAFENHGESLRGGGHAVEDGVRSTASFGRFSRDLPKQDVPVPPTGCHDSHGPAGSLFSIVTLVTFQGCCSAIIVEQLCDSMAQTLHCNRMPRLSKFRNGCGMTVILA